MRHWQKTPFVTLEEIEGLPPKDYAAMTQKDSGKIYPFV